MIIKMDDKLLSPRIENSYSKSGDINTRIAINYEDQTIGLKIEITLDPKLIIKNVIDEINKNLIKENNDD